MKTPLRVVDGSQFVPTVMPSGPITAPAEKPKRDLRDDYLVMLCSLRGNVPKDSTEDQALVRWVFARMEANKFADELLEKLQAVAADKLIVEWEESKAKVREQQAKIDKHKEEIARETITLNRLSEVRGKRQTEWDIAQQTKKQLGRYAAQRDLDKANMWLLKCEAEVEIANQQHATVQQRINIMNLVEMKPLAEKLNELAADEARLAHMVLGTSYTTPEGLVVPARAPLK
jgi:hypothetical protein